MLTKDELQYIIYLFNEDELKRQGIFGIYQYGGSTDESFIRANKEGLILFALKLLKTARDFENELNDPKKNSIPFDYDEDWEDETSDTFIQHIEPIEDKQKFRTKTEYESNFMDKLMPFGCGQISIVVLISVLVGLFTIYNWIF